MAMSFDRAAAPILGRNLTYGMLDTLGRAIVTGTYEERDFPTEADLSRDYGVSRSVTREAVKMLTAKGLLSARPRQGTVVQPASAWSLLDADVLRWLMERKFSRRLLREFTELRHAIEPAAAALAAERADDLRRAGIERGFRRMVAAERGDDDVLGADIAFHVAILQAADNPFFAQFEPVVASALHSSIRFTNRIKGHSASLEQHDAVRHAIMACDPAAARAAMDKLIVDVLALIGAASGA